MMALRLKYDGAERSIDHRLFDPFADHFVGFECSKNVLQHVSVDTPCPAHVRAPAVTMLIVEE